MCYEDDSVMNMMQYVGRQLYDDDESEIMCDLVSDDQLFRVSSYS